MSVRKWGFLICFLPLLLPWLGVWHGQRTGAVLLFLCWTFIVMFGMVPLLDQWIGRDTRNPSEADVAALSNANFYRAITLLCLPLQYLSLFAAAYYATQLHSPLHWLAWTLSLGAVGGVMAINVAHELIHKSDKVEQWAGGLLLASVCYGGFKVEHLRGHHVHVSTPDDASSARYNESLYHFLPRAIVRNIRNAFALEAAHLRHKQLSVWSWHNELLWWYGVSLLILLGLATLWGASAALFFIGQSVMAFVLLEIINYVEHYGLHRRRLADGRYERVTHQHSWNSSFLLTNLFLLHLQRHSDHHAFPKRRYQTLRHFDDSPQLPSGYATMVVLALIPPLWRRIMNPRVKAYYQDDNALLSN